MPPSRNPEFARLEAAAAEAVAASQWATAADCHARAASLHLAEGSPDRAEWHLIQAQGHARRARRPDITSQYTRLRGVLARSQGRSDDARRLLTEAAGQARMADAADEVLLAEDALIKLLDQQGDWAGARANADHAIAYALDRDRHADVAALLEVKAKYETLLGRSDRAEHTLQQAVAAATEANDPVLQLRMRWTLYQLQVSQARPPFEALDALAEAANELDGVDDVRWEVDLLRAAEHTKVGELQTAAQLAAGVRDSALAARHLETYLQAILLLADVFDRHGARPRALLSLLMAHKTLGNLLGAEAAAPVQHVLASYETRWGPRAFAEAMEQLKAQAQPT